MPIHYIASAVHWLLKEAGSFVFGVVKQRLVDNMGLNTKTITPSNTPVLVDEYLHRFEERLAQRIINRLDEDRIVKLNSAIMQLKTAAKMATQTPFKQGHLLNAVGNFFDTANLPEQGITAGFQNAELRYLASLGIAAVYLEMKEPLEEDIAKYIVTAIYADPVTAKLWFGDEVVARLLTICPQCGLENDLTATFCIQCGHALPALGLTVQPGRGIVEEQLKRARRRKKEIQDFITEAEHMQGNLLQSSKRLLNAMSHLNGTRDDEFTITEKNENASVGNPALQSQLEQLRWQEKLHHERTRDNRTRPHTDPIKSATSMSDDQLLDHWKPILAAYRERLGVIDTRIRGLEMIRARLAAGKI